MILSLDPDYPNMKRVKSAAHILREGGLLAYPTDTTYGIGVDPFQPKAVAKLFEATRRKSLKPPSLLCADIKMAGQYGVFENSVFKLMKKALPGPFTLIVPTTGEVPRYMHGKRNEVGIRIPESAIVQELIATLGTPVLNVSARDPEGNYLGDAGDIERYYGYHLGAIIDCGGLEPRESTVIDFVERTPELVRVGLGDPGLFHLEVQPTEET